MLTLHIVENYKIPLWFKNDSKKTTTAKTKNSKTVSVQLREVHPRRACWKPSLHKYSKHIKPCYQQLPHFILSLIAIFFSSKIEFIKEMTPSPKLNLKPDYSRLTQQQIHVRLVFSVFSTDCAKFHCMWWLFHIDAGLPWHNSYSNTHVSLVAPVSVCCVHAGTEKGSSGNLLGVLTSLLISSCSH